MNKTNNETKMKLTIDKTNYRLIARDAAGNILASRATNCNPAALHQIILDTKMLDATIDWKNSMVSKPGRK
jgi:hypothetical protein